MCIVKDKSIVSWCITDYVVESECEFRIETDKEFRKQGIGTYLVQQILKLFKEKKIQKVGWQCSDSNTASYKLAEKNGFDRKTDRYYYHGWYNSFDNNLVNGQYYLDQVKDFKKGAQFYEKAFKMLEDGHKDACSSAIFAQEGVEKWCYYNAACSWGLVEDIDKAFSNIYKAINKGWSDFEMLIGDERFISLHTDERWNTLKKYEK